MRGPYPVPTRYLKAHISDVKKSVEDGAVIFRNSFTKAYPGSIHALEGVAKVVLNNGQLLEDREFIEIKGADKVLVYIDVEVIYDPKQSVAGEMQSNDVGSDSQL